MPSLISSLRKTFVSLCFFSFLILLTNCSEDKSPTQNEPTAEAEKFYEDIVKPQEEKFQLFEDLTAFMDTIQAMDSVLKVFLQDSVVESGEVGEQGIAIQYKNGMRGGLLIDPLDYPDIGEVDLEDTFSKVNNDLNSKSIQKVIPTSKKTIFLNPSYWERKKYADILISNYNSNLQKVGFDQPIVYKNEEASVDKFANLSDYGIIHIYSHGWAWPKPSKIKEVYLLTGEVVTWETYIDYFEELQNNEIIIAYSKHSKKDLLLISPKFINKRNNFANKSTLMYGGFCFSNLGSWPQTIVSDVGAGGYFGFDWSVRTIANSKWNYHLIKSLSLINGNNSPTVIDWMNNTYPKKYWSTKHNKNVNIKYTGQADLALKSNVVEEGPYNVCDIKVQYYGYYYNKEDSSFQSEDLNIEASNSRIPGSFVGNTFTGYYTNNDAEDPMDDQIELVFSDDFKMIESVNWIKHYKSSTWGVNSEEVKFVGKNIPFDENLHPYYFDVGYRVLGEATCNSITSLSHVWVGDEVPNNYTHKLDHYICDGSSMIQIRLDKE